jgi:hypothetical protein
MYLIRLDDACSTMDHQKWIRIESLLDQLGVRPIVAVVPDNQDPTLKIMQKDPMFWNRVRNWQAKGWTIAMHGYQHLFHPVDRKKLILPFYDRSEFAGLSLGEQSDRLNSSWKLFQSEGVSPTVWVAPAHCFDHNTLLALKAETPIQIISDGIALNQFYYAGFQWLPQQLWSFVDKPFGLWTICLHPNTMSNDDILKFEKLLSSKAILNRVISADNITIRNRRKGILDHGYAFWFWNRNVFYRTFVSLRSHLNALLGWFRSRN